MVQTGLRRPVMVLVPPSQRNTTRMLRDRRRAPLPRRINTRPTRLARPTRATTQRPGQHGARENYEALELSPSAGQRPPRAAGYRPVTQRAQQSAATKRCLADFAHGCHPVDAIRCNHVPPGAQLCATDPRRRPRGPTRRPVGADESPQKLGRFSEPPSPGMDAPATRVDCGRYCHMPCRNQIRGSR